MESKIFKKFILFSALAIFSIFLVSCGGTAQPNSGPDITVNIDPDLPTAVPEPEVEVEASSIVAEPESSSDGAYPGPVEEANTAGYPEPEEQGSVEVPNPDRDIQIVDQATGSVGGVLVRELENGGYQSIIPIDLFLAEMVLNSEGEAMFIGKTDGSPSASLFDTGVFIFQGVVPDTYGLVIDLGFSQFPITDENGELRLIEVTADEAIDLGQVFVELPN